jgi:3-phenylpropionate/trans-cinnamate dioxygenase ferredoxin subunit
VKRTFACKADDIPDGGALRVDLDPPVALFRVGEQVYATADSCTHEEWSLGEEGEVDGFEVTCSLHLASFDIRTGRPLCLPATRALQTYTVTVEDGDVYIAEPSATDEGQPMHAAQRSEG